MADPGQHLVAGSSDLWTNSGSQAERALNSGWILDNYINSTGGYATNAQPSTAVAFLSTGDGTTGSGNSFYALGRTVRVVHTGGTAYGRISASALAGGQTTVTLGTFYNGGTTSLSTTAITSAAVALEWFSTGQSGNAQSLPLSAPSRFWGL